MQHIYQQHAGKLKKLFIILRQKRTAHPIQSVMKIVYNYLKFWMPVSDIHSKFVVVLVWIYSEAYVTN